MKGEGLPGSAYPEALVNSRSTWPAVRTAGKHWKTAFSLQRAEGLGGRGRREVGVLGFPVFPTSGDHALFAEYFIYFLSFVQNHLLLSIALLAQPLFLHFTSRLFQPANLPDSPHSPCEAPACEESARMRRSCVLRRKAISSLAFCYNVLIVL